MRQPVRVGQGSVPSGAANLPVDRLSQASSMSSSTNVQRLAQVQAPGLDSARNPQASDFVTQDQLKAALKEESEYWSARCMGEISRFECEATANRDAQQAALESKFDEKLSEASEQIRVEMKASERRVSEMLERSTLRSDAQSPGKSIEDSLHSCPESVASTKAEETSLRHVHSEIEGSRSEMKELKKTVQFFSNQQRQSVEHAECLIADLRKDLELFRDEEMGGIDIVKSAQKDLRKELSDSQRDLKEKISEIQRRSSNDASQHYEDLTSMIEASTARVKADMASEIARLQKDIDADRAVELNRAASEAQQLKETLDGKADGLKAVLELTVHERMQEHVNRQDQLYNVHREAQQNRMESIEALDAENQKGILELQGRLRQAEDSLKQTFSTDVERLSSRLAAVEMEKPLELEELSRKLEAIESEGNHQRARLEIAEQALQRQPLLQGSLQQTAAVMDLDSLDARFAAERSLTKSTLQQPLSTELERMGARLLSVEASCRERTVHEAAMPTTAAIDTGTAEDVAAIMARLDMLEHSASCRTTSCPPTKTTEAANSDGLVALALRVDQMGVDLTDFQRSYQESFGLSQSQAASTGTEGTEVAQLRVMFNGLRSEVSKLNESAAQAALAEDVAMKAAELIQSERKKVEEVATNASHLIQNEIQKMSAERLGRGGDEMEHLVSSRIKKVQAELRSEFTQFAKTGGRAEASAASGEARVSQRILDDLGLRVDKVESTFLQNAQVGLRFHALESEVKATSRLLETIVKNPSRKVGSSSLDTTTETTFVQDEAALRPYDSPAVDPLARFQNAAPLDARVRGLRQPSSPPSFSDEHSGGAPSVAGSACEASQDMKQLLSDIRLVRDMEQAGDATLQDISKSQIINRVQNILSKESHLVASEMPPPGTPLPLDLKESLEGLFKKLGRTLGSGPTPGSAAPSRDVVSLSHSGMAESLGRPAEAPGNNLHNDMEKLLQQLQSMSGGVGPSADVPGADGQQVSRKSTSLFAHRSATPDAGNRERLSVQANPIKKRQDGSVSIDPSGRDESQSRHQLRPTDALNGHSGRGLSLNASRGSGNAMASQLYPRSPASGSTDSRRATTSDGPRQQAPTGSRLGNTPGLGASNQRSSQSPVGQRQVNEGRSSLAAPSRSPGVPGNANARLSASPETRCPQPVAPATLGSLRSPYPASRYS